MSNLPVLAITVDKDQPGGLNALLGQASGTSVWDPDTGNTSSGSGGIAMMALDAFEMRIYFVDVANDNAAFVFDAGSTIWCSLVVSAELTEDDAVVELVRVSPFTLDTDHYKADLDLNTDDVLDAVGDAESVPCILDIRVTYNTSRVTYRVPVTLYRPAIGDVAASNPIAATWANVDGAQMRQRPDGLIEFYDFTLSKWVVPVLKNGVIEYQENA